MGSTWKRSRSSSTWRLTSVGLGRALWRKTPRPSGGSRWRAKLLVLALQLAGSPRALARQQVSALGGLGLDLADSLSERLGVDAQVAGDLGDRAIGLKDEPDAAIGQTDGVLRVSTIAEIPPSDH